MFFPFLRLIPLKDWLYAGIIATALIVFGVYTHHERKIGAAKVVAADTAALIMAQKIADVQTAKLAQKAEDASHVHDQELTDLRTYRSEHPVHVGVCRTAGNSLPGLPKGSPAIPGDAATSPASGDVQPLLTGDSGRDTDIGPLLDLLAGKADAVSSVLREYQNR